MLLHPTLELSDLAAASSVYFDVHLSNLSLDEKLPEIPNQAVQNAIGQEHEDTNIIRLL